MVLDRKIDTSQSLDVVGTLQRLVRTESWDPSSGELAVAKTVYETLQGLKIEATLDEFAPGRANVLGRVRGVGKKRAVVLSAHMDTLAIGTTPWSDDPFSGSCRNGRLYGRGSADMKGALVAMIATAERISQRSTPLAGDVILAFSAGESSDMIGARRFAQMGLKEEIGAFICGEPSGLDIIVVEKAALWLRATAAGRIGHVSGDGGISAISLMIDFLDRLSKCELVTTPHPLLDGPSVNVGLIAGGTSISVTPDRCIADFDVRFEPGNSFEDILSQIRVIAPQGVTISTLDAKPSIESKVDDPFVQLCTQVCTKIRDEKPRILGTSFISDGAILLEDVHSPFIILGPGDLGASGQANESIAIENLNLAEKIYAHIIELWLSGTEAELCA